MLCFFKKVQAFQSTHCGYKRILLTHIRFSMFSSLPRKFGRTSGFLVGAALSTVNDDNIVLSRVTSMLNID